MAYQTGVITSAADLVTVVRDFAVANGWSASGDVLNKGASHVRLTAPSLSEVRIEGARGGNFAAPDQCPRYARIYNTDWPASAVYHLVAFDNPDTLWCTINFAVNRHQHLGFGTIEKYGAWEGGGWFHGHHTTSNIGANCLAVVDGKGRPYYSASPNNCALFWSQQDYSPWGNASNNKCSFLHCELRGEVWPATGATNDASDLNIIHCPSVLSPIQKYNPNAFNGQTVLTPFQLFLQNTDGHYMSIGHLGHLRFVRLTNYNPGDVIELGADRWKLFPWHIKDANYPDGKAPAYSNSSFSTGLLGISVRYDGP